MKLKNLCKRGHNILEVGRYSNGLCKECSRLHYKNNICAYAVAHKKWVEKNSRDLASYQKQWRKDNASTMNAHCRARQSLKLRALPSWVNLKEIEEYYTVAKWYSEDTGIDYEVDHIWPLQPLDRAFVGLHVPWNLQIVTRKENRRKLNKRPSVLL